MVIKYIVLSLLCLCVLYNTIYNIQSFIYYFTHEFVSWNNTIYNSISHLYSHNKSI